MVVVFIIILIFLIIASNIKKSHFKQLTVAFDFDDCLKNVNNKKPLKQVVNKLKEHYEKGNRVIVVTARPTRGLYEVRRFFKDEIKYDIPIEIYNTGDNKNYYKSPIIGRENVDIFYDDQVRFLEDVRNNHPHVKLYQTFPVSDNKVQIKPF